MPNFYGLELGSGSMVLTLALKVQALVSTGSCSDNKLIIAVIIIN